MIFVVADTNTSQEEMFELVGLPITTTCLEGFNGTIICYGQTGSGKSYTTFGTADANSNANRGLVPRVLEYLWEHIAVDGAELSNNLKCKCSFYEIYQERVYDLLVRTINTLLDSRVIKFSGRVVVREPSSEGGHQDGSACGGHHRNGRLFSFGCSCCSRARQS